jgi:hypothetical protein
MHTILTCTYAHANTHTQLSMKLEAATKHYGVCILMTDSFYDVLPSKVSLFSRARTHRHIHTHTVTQSLSLIRTLSVSLSLTFSFPLSPLALCLTHARAFFVSHMHTLTRTRVRAHTRTTRTHRYKSCAGVLIVCKNQEAGHQSTSIHMTSTHSVNLRAEFQPSRYVCL